METRVDDECRRQEHRERKTQPPHYYSSFRVCTQPRLVRRRRKSCITYWPSVIVEVKYARPRATSQTFATKWTSAGSRANMKVLIRIPDFLHAPTSLKVSRRTRGSSPIGFL